MSNNIIIFTLFFIIIFLLYKLQKVDYIFKKTNKFNESMYKISKHIDSIDTLENLYSLILKELINIIDVASSGSILIYNKKSRVMEYRAAVGFDFDKLKSITLDVKELFLYKQTQLKKACIIKNPHLYNSSYLKIENYKFLKDINALDIKSTLSLPICIDGNFFGVLNIDSKNSFSAFSQTDLQIANYIKKQLEQAIKTILLINSLKEDANYDYLTGIINRRYFEKQFKNIHSKSKCVLALIDLNDFKLINDTYGHLEGDFILKEFSNTVKNHIRENDLFARLGGDEFVILFKDTDKKIAQNRINEIQENLKDIIRFGVGIEEVDFESNASLDDLLMIVDKKMYKDKIKNKFL